MAEKYLRLGKLSISSTDHMLDALILPKYTPILKDIRLVVDGVTTLRVPETLLELESPVILGSTLEEIMIPQGVLDRSSSITIPTTAKIIAV